MFAASSGIWTYHPHPEVWGLVVGLVALYVYAIRVVGPNAVALGEPIVTFKQIRRFVYAIVLLWGASDWPMHDLAENSMYSVHMLQHMILSYFMPPLLLLSLPEWLLRLVVGDGRLYRVVRWLARPVIAGVAFNAVVMITHIPGVVNASVANGPLHYVLHVSVVVLSLLMWMPVCGPLPEVRINPGPKMIYLFAQSIVPTVPAGWLTFAEGVVYKSYANTPKLWHLTPQYDQQLAGVIMKIGGSVFLWTLTTVIFFRRFMGNWEAENDYGRRHMHDPEPLTYDQVTDVFDRVPAPREPAPHD